MCRRCIIIKGRAVGKSTEFPKHECVGEPKCDACHVEDLERRYPGYKSFVRADGHDVCRALVEIGGKRSSMSLVISKLAMAEVRKGMYPDVSMSSRFIPGKLVGDTPMKTVTKVGIEDGKLKVEGEEKCAPDAITYCAEACEKCGHCSHCCDCEET